MGNSVLESLIERSKRMPQVTAEGWTTEYVVFSRVGFTDAAIATAKIKQIRLVTLDEVEQAHIQMVEAQR